MRKEKQASFVKNAVILSAAGLISRMIGALYRIPLYRLISKEGIGLYQMGYYVYNVLLAVSATGIPVAISKLVAEETSKNRMGEARRIFKVAALLLTSIGFVITLLLVFFAPFISRVLIKEPRALYPLIAVAPAIFIVALMASFRGFFQGMQMMWPTAISQLTEQIGRVITVLVLAWIMVKNNARIEFTAAAASFGAVAGAACGLLIILLIYFRNMSYVNKMTKQNPQISNRTTKQIIKRILVFAVPITLGAMVLPLMNGIDTVLVPRRLHAAGFSASEATGMYGDLTGAAIPLINLPSMLAYALAASLVPAISNANAKGNYQEVRNRAKMAVKLILIIGFPAAAGLSLLAGPITLMLYGSMSAATILEILAFAVIFLTLHQTCSGILQGLGLTGIPVRNLVIGGIIKIVLNYTLTVIPSINIHGAAIASIVAYGVAATLNISAVCKNARMKIDWSSMVIKPLIATGCMALTVTAVYNGLVYLNMHNAIATLLSVGAGALVYGIGILLVRCFSEQELKAIPYIGDLIIRLSQKLKF